MMLISNYDMSQSYLAVELASTHSVFSLLNNPEQFVNNPYFSFSLIKACLKEYTFVNLTAVI